MYMHTQTCMGLEVVWAELVVQSNKVILLPDVSHAPIGQHYRYIV